MKDIQSDNIGKLVILVIVLYFIIWVIIIYAINFNVDRRVSELKVSIDSLNNNILDDEYIVCRYTKMIPNYAIFGGERFLMNIYYDIRTNEICEIKIVLETKWLGEGEGKK